MKNTIRKRLLAMITVFAMIVAVCPAVLAADEDLTRGEAANMLLVAADDYNEGVVLSDIMYGYEDGEMHEDYLVTRAEALVMLRRAFGEFPELTGHNAIVAIPAGDFTDIPDWATDELNDVFEAGLVAGTSNGIFSPDEVVTKSQMEKFIERVYSMFGTNLKDDFYATVNKEDLDSIALEPGDARKTVISDLGIQASDNVSEILDEIVSGAGEYEHGTKEQKIADAYNNYMNTDARNSAGLEPIQEYIDMINSAESINDLVNVQCLLDKDLVVEPYFTFGVDSDFDDATKKMLYFGQYTLFFSKETYTESTDTQKTAYTDYIKNLFEIAGVENAEEAAQNVYDAEVLLAGYSLDSTDYNDASKVNNKYTLSELKEIFPNVDLGAVFEASGYSTSEKICVMDVGFMEAFADFFCDDNLDVLKNMALKQLLLSVGTALSEDFAKAEATYNAELYAVSDETDIEDLADDNVMSLFEDYLSELYIEKYFDERSKEDVESLITDIVAVYRERIQNLDWMSDETKQNAIKKLDNLNPMVGYPDSWDTYLDNTDILSIDDGGSYFDNYISVLQAARSDIAAKQNDPVDKTKWDMSTFTANAYYSPLTNSIVILAGILQSPIYDYDMSYAEKMGGIGFVVAHEITHGFDSSGSQYDENGNVANWWTDEDRAAFNELCEKVVEFYDGEEGIPGIPESGTLTLTENIADLGAVSCVTEIISKTENPDYQALYTNIAKIWMGTVTREYAEYMAKNDVHSQYKLRANRTIVNLDEFYEAFDITEGDGMYVAPEDRVKIW